MSDWLFLLPLDNLTPLPSSAVDEILKAADCGPSTVDRQKLARELALRNHWQGIQPLFAKSAMREEAKFANKVADEAEKLFDLLLESPSGSFSAWKTTILELSLDARRQAERQLPTMDLAVSALEWVIGEYLAAIYSRLSGRKAGFSTNSYSEQRGGPFVAFVETVFRHNDIHKDDGPPYSKETIKKALSRVKQARSGKRGKRTKVVP